jgi:alcohol dehydrogenase
MVEKDYGELAAELPGGVAPNAAGLMAWCDELIGASGLPATLEAAGVAADDLPMLAADAMLQQRLLVNNPVEVTQANALQLYEKAWSG